jgi:hypothetical protein
MLLFGHHAAVTLTVLLLAYKALYTVTAHPKRQATPVTVSNITVSQCSKQNNITEHSTHRLHALLAVCTTQLP